MSEKALSLEIVGKRLELLTQAVPGLSQVAVLAEVAARALGVRLQFVEATRAL